MKRIPVIMIFLSLVLYGKAENPPVKTFEEAVQEEIFQMTPFVTVEEETVT